MGRTTKRGFISIKSDFDDLQLKREAIVKEAGKLISEYAVKNSDTSTADMELNINKLLTGYGDKDRADILTQAVIHIVQNEL